MVWRYSIYHSYSRATINFSAWKRYITKAVDIEPKDGSINVIAIEPKVT